MSTRAIREALELVQCTCRDHTCAGCRARSEVEAIEKAARAYAHHVRAWSTMLSSEDFTQLERTFCSIAKEAP